MDIHGAGQGGENEAQNPVEQARPHFTMKLHGIRLSTRITLGAVVFVVAGAVALMFIEEARLRDVYLSEQRAVLEQNLRAEELRLKQTLDTLREDVLFLSDSPPVSGIMRAALNRGHDPRYGYASQVWEERLQQIFAAFSKAHPIYNQIRFIGVADGGRELVRIDNRAGRIEVTPADRLQAKGDRDYFRATSGLREGQVYLSEFNLNREGGAVEQPYWPTLRAATPVFATSGKIFGMVIINIDANSLLQAHLSSFSRDARTYIANSDGQYLLHHDARRAFTFELGASEPGGKDKITMDFPLLETMFEPGAPEHLPLQTIATKAGVQYLAAERIHFDSGNPARFLLLAYSMPEAVAAQQVAGIPAKHVLGGFIAMLLAGGIALLVLRRTFAPLEQLAAAADKIAAGNHDVPLPQNGSGEIGSLADALNAMLAKLSQREREIGQINAGLEERVKERTIELELAQQKTEGILHELGAQQVELEMQNDELRRAQTIIETSRDRYMDLYDFAPVGYLTLTREALISEINLAGAALLGRERDKLIGYRFARLVTPEDGDRWHLHFMRALQHGDKQSCELVLRREDGYRFHVQLDCLRVEADGESPVVRISLTDITERKRSEGELRIAAAAFETQDAIMIADADGNIIRVNQAFSAITGYSAEEVLGKSLDMINSEQDGDADCIALLQQSIRDGSWAGEIYGKRKNGQIYPKWMTVTAVKNERQETTHYVSIFSDITVRKQVGEAKLRESEERFRGTLEQAAVGIAHATLDGYFQQANQKFCTITGYSRDELLNMSFQDITFPDDLDENTRCRRQLFAGEIAAFSLEKRYVRKDRCLIWVNLTVSLLRDADGMPQYTIGVIEDITERKHSEALAQRFGSLLQNSFDEIYIFDAHTLHFLLTSEGAEINLGYSSEELNGLTPLDIEPLFTRESFEQLLAPLQRGEQTLLAFEAVHRRKDGTTYPVEARMQYMESDYPVFMAVAQDVSERRSSERQLRDLSAHLQTVREEEKARIAREIHDDLGGTLTALKMDIYWLADEFYANKEAAALLGHIESMSQLLDNAVSVTRRVITDLRPTVLDDIGLRAALEYQAGQFQKRTGIQCWVTGSCAGDCKNELDKTQAINLFRIFQESLTNVARHSGASSVEAELQCDEGEIMLTVSDNGCGMPEGHTVAATSFGMIGMRERVLQLGGRINFYSPPGGGFSVTVILPLPTDKQREKEA